MPKDFSGQNLRGRSFKGQDLAGANFSNADLRGANFTGANLQGANFTGAKAGLPLRWAIFLVIISWLVSGLSGFLFVFNAALISLIFDSSNTSNQVAGWTALIVTIIIFAIIIRQGIAVGAGAGSFAGVVAVVAAFVLAKGVGDVVAAFAFAFAGVIALAVALAGARAFALGFTVFFTFAFAVAFAGVEAGDVSAATVTNAVVAGVVVGVEAGVGTLAVAVAVVIAVAVAGARTGTVAVVIAIAVAGARAGTVAGAGAGAGAVVVAGALISTYIAWRVMKEDEKDTKAWDIAIAFAAFGGTTFYNADLTDVDFTRATLKNTDFRKAKLTRTRFYSTKKLYLARVGSSILSNRCVLNLLVTGNGRKKSYTGLNLKGANLIDADLKEVNLKDTDITEATFQEACLERTNLSGLNLSGTNLSGANLSGANLSGTNLSGANLSGTNLSGTNLSGTNLSGKNLSGTNLSGTNLSEANLSGTNLSGADLSEACLIKIQALGTNFTTAKLTGACLEDWNINSTTKLDDIDCKYVYLKNGKQERRPSSGEFAPGEFTKLFQKALETVDLIFADGIDWKAFLKSLQELQMQYGDVAVQAIEKKSGDAFVVRLEVPQEFCKAEIERQAKQLYEVELNKLEEIYREKLKAKKSQIKKYRRENANLWEVVKTLAGSKSINQSINVEAKAVAGDDIRQSGNFGIGVNKGEVNTEKLAGNINEAESKTLMETAVEIQALLEQLEKSYPTDTTMGKMALAAEAIAQIDSNPTLTARILSALQVGSVKAFEQFLNHPAASFVIGALEDWQKTKGN